MLFVNKNLLYIEEEFYNPPVDYLPVTDTMAVYAPLCFGGHLTIYEKKFCPVFSTYVPSFTYVENIVFFSNNTICEEVLQGVFICLERDVNKDFIKIDFKYYSL